MLRPGGRFVASVNHPMRWPFPDSPDPDDLRVISSYFDRRRTWRPMPTGGRSTSSTTARSGTGCAAVGGAGLVLEDLIEPEWTPGRTQEWGQWSPARGALIPGTLILVGRLIPPVGRRGSCCREDRRGRGHREAAPPPARRPARRGRGPPPVSVHHRTSTTTRAPYPNVAVWCCTHSRIVHLPWGGTSWPASGVHRAFARRSGDAGRS